MKKKALLIFSDLDGTLFPAKGEYISELSKKLKTIQDTNDVQIKFIVVSGRNTGHTRAMAQHIEHNLKEADVKNPVDFSFSEQGGAYVCANSQVEHKFLGNKEKLHLKNILKSDFENSKFAIYFEQCPLNQYNSAFVFKSSISKSLSTEDKSTIRKEFLNFLKNRYGKTMNIEDSGAIEVTPPGIGKDFALEYTLRQYRKEFNISGLIYCGDSGNDLSAIKYVSKLAIGTGIKSYVFTPSNAKPQVSSEKLENWKDKLSPRVEKNIEKSDLKTIEGLNSLLDKHIKNKDFIGEGLDTLSVKDDLALLTRHKQTSCFEQKLVL